jgi:PAS domain S-box-containing protein
MIKRKAGYLEYNWKNPGDKKPRAKALYMVYFKPWDWIINVSSYRKEFASLVDIDDFRNSVLALSFGNTGYAFVTDGSGNVIIHPLLQGINIFHQKAMPQEPLRRMLAMKNGKLIYSWKNPGESRPRKKLVIFNYIPEYDWIVASSSYLDEFYAPLATVGNVIVFTLLATLALVLPLTFFISGSITKPLNRLIQRLDFAPGADRSGCREIEKLNEVDQLTRYFDSYIARLMTSSQNLQEEIRERKQIEAELRVSEERYRSVMEAAPDPIIAYDMEGRVTYMNPAFTKVFGWTLDECLGKKMDHFVPPDHWEETLRGLDTITSGRMLSTVDTRRLTKSGARIDVSVRGAVYRDRQGDLAGSVIIHRDVTDLKRLEKEILDIGDRERQKIGQDLHDDLAPHLIGIEGLGKVLTAKLAERTLPEADLAGKVTALIKEAITKTRRLARGLCPVYLVDHGLESSLRELAMQTESVFGIRCLFICNAPVLVRDNIVATHLYHMVQEAVHNAIRHGKADRIRIDLRVSGGRTSLTVLDNGSGIPDDVRPGGMGLRIMGFRAKMIDAALDIRRRAEGGTRVHVTLSGEDCAPLPVAMLEPEAGP